MNMPHKRYPDETCDQCGARHPAKHMRVIGGGKSICPDCYEAYRLAHKAEGTSANTRPGRVSRGHLIFDEGQMKAREEARRKTELARQIEQKHSEEETNARIREQALRGKRGRPNEK